MTLTALADPTRFRIVEMLAANGSLAVGEIRKEFKISPPAVSQHLKVLKDAKLVMVKANAQQRIYTLNPSGIIEIEDWLSKMRRMWEKRFDALDALLLEEKKKITVKKGKRK